MDQTVLGYTSWNVSPRNSLNAIRLRTNEVPETAAMGVAVEGSKSAWPGETNEAILPPFDEFKREPRRVDIFNRGSESFDFMATADESWIQLSASKGTVEDGTPVEVSVDWDKAPNGSAEGTGQNHRGWRDGGGEGDQFQAGRTDTSGFEGVCGGGSLCFHGRWGALQ